VNDLQTMRRLARAEQDCVVLHKTLAEAIRRISRANTAGGVPHIDYDDLLEVLDRTSQPSIDVVPRCRPDDEEYEQPQGVDVDMVPKA
jgi:hypothetical protein